MSATSKIEWTEKTWNPVTGCDKVSSGCKHCYAEVMARRLTAMGAAGYENQRRATTTSLLVQAGCDELEIRDAGSRVVELW